MPDNEYDWNFISFNAWRKKLRSIRSFLTSGRKGLFTFGALVLVILAPYILALVFYIGKNDIQYYGLVTQIIGFLFALYGVNSKLKQFGLLTIPRRIWLYWRKFPVLPIQHTRTVSVFANVQAGSAIASGTAAVVNTGEPSIEDRLNKLEERYESLLRQIGEIEKKQKDDKKEIMADLTSVRGLSDAKINNLRSKISQLIEDGVELEVFGIGLFIIGMIYSTIPDDTLLIINSFTS